MAQMMNKPGPSLNPLDVDLVLKKVMGFVGMSDLKNCRVANQMWRYYATNAMEAKGSLIARIRPDEFELGGKSVSNFMALNSIKTYNFRLDGFDLTNLSTFEEFAKEYLKEAKCVTFLDCLWDYDGLNNLLRDMKSLEVLVIQTMIHIPTANFNANNFGNMNFSCLKRIDIHTTIQYSASHLACISRASPMLSEVNAFTERDTKTLVTCLIEYPDLVSKVTTLGITSTPTPEWDNAKLMMTVLATRRLQLSSLTIGLGTLNDHHAQFYHTFLLSVRMNLKHLSIRGQEWWRCESAYYLPVFPELETLELEFVMDGGEQHLDRVCPVLKSLKLVASDILINHDYDAPGQGYLTQLETLEYLNMDPTVPLNRDENAFRRVIDFVPNVVVFVGQLRPAEFSIVVKGLTRLNSLTLASASNISDVDIVTLDEHGEWITPLPKGLETFVIQAPHDCIITNTCLEGFAKCKDLTRLELPNSNVTSRRALLANRKLKTLIV